MSCRERSCVRAAALVRVILTGLMCAFFLAAGGSVQCADDGVVDFTLIGPAGERVPMNITLRNVATGEEYTFAAGTGHSICLLPAGKYGAYMRALWGGVGYVVHAQDVEVIAGDVVEIKGSFVEGVGRVGLPAYDTDFDGVIDRVEHEQGTDPMDRLDIPGVSRVEFDQGVLNKEEKWYRGELRCYSTRSGGKLRIRDIIRQAEKKRLDFIAITDKRTLESCKDAAYKSHKVLLIPAFEWGVEGHATLLGAKTFIKNWDNNPQVQAAVDLAHRQGVIFSVVDPCSAVSPWEWSVGGFHAMEVWSGRWRSARATHSRALGRGERTQHLIPNSDLQLSLAFEDIGKNGQALRFWDKTLKRGYRVTAVGGSGASDRAADIGSPITYVYARELSVPAITDGLHAGHTFVTASTDGPRLLLMADVDRDNTFEGVQGSVVPIPPAKEGEREVRLIKTEGGEVRTETVGHVVEPIQFRVVIDNLKEKGTIKLNVIKNGELLESRIVEPDKPVYEFMDGPWEPGFYRVELFKVVSDDKASKGYGNVEMLAVTSPIYVDWLPMPEKLLKQPPSPEESEKTFVPE